MQRDQFDKCSESGKLTFATEMDITQNNSRTEMEILTCVLNRSTNWI